MDIVDAAAATAIVIKSKKERKKRQWMKPQLDEGLRTKKFQKFFGDVRSNKKKFSDYFQMSVECFDKLLKAVRSRIKYKNTVFRAAVSPEERLAVTLRYLSTGCSFHSLHSEYLLGLSTVSEIIRDTCTAIWDCLEADYMCVTNDGETWLKMADDFHQLTSFPNCIGSLGAKCIPTKTKSPSGENFSILLMAMANVDYSFAAVEVWTHDEGYNHPCDFFKRTKLGSMLESGELNLPIPKCLPNEEGGSPMPFVFAAGDAFAVSDNVLRSYPSRRSMAAVECRIFNRRLDRATRMVDISFAMMAVRWQILDRTLDVHVTSCEAIVKAICILHNFVHKHDGVRFEDTLYRSSLKDMEQPLNRGNRAGLKTRDYFAQYFVSPPGSVPWQERA